MRTDRIPGFAICAHCGLRVQLAACPACGLLTCDDCRDVDQCVICFRERKEWARRTLRRARAWRWTQRTVAAGITGLGLTVVMGGPLMAAAPHGAAVDAHAAIVARGEVRFVADAVDRYLDDHGGQCPRALHELVAERYLAAPATDPWGEPLLFGCVDTPRSFVVISKGADHETGTGDDLSFLAP